VPAAEWGELLERYLRRSVGEASWFIEPAGGQAFAKSNGKCAVDLLFARLLGQRRSVGCVAANYGMPSEYARPNRATGDLCRSDI
jgi:hypothetical protein